MTACGFRAQNQVVRLIAPFGSESGQLHSMYCTNSSHLRPLVNRRLIKILTSEEKKKKKKKRRGGGGGGGGGAPKSSKVSRYIHVERECSVIGARGEPRFLMTKGVRTLKR